VPIGGSTGTGYYVLPGSVASESLARSLACHRVGRATSRIRAFECWSRHDVAQKVTRLIPLACLKG
jgi:RNA-splicing ligase RtcB